MFCCHLIIIAIICFLACDIYLFFEGNSFNNYTLLPFGAKPEDWTSIGGEYSMPPLLQNSAGDTIYIDKSVKRSQSLDTVYLHSIQKYAWKHDSLLTAVKSYNDSTIWILFTSDSDTGKQTSCKAELVNSAEVQKFAHFRWKDLRNYPRFIKAIDSFIEKILCGNDKERYEQFIDYMCYAVTFFLVLSIISLFILMIVMQIHSLMHIKEIYVDVTNRYLRIYCLLVPWIPLVLWLLLQIKDMCFY